MDIFVSDARILASVTKIPHLHPLTLAKVFGVTRQIAASRPKTMQEGGLVEQMKSGQYRILLSSSYTTQPDNQFRVSSAQQAG